MKKSTVIGKPPRQQSAQITVNSEPGKKYIGSLTVYGNPKEILAKIIAALRKP